MLPNFEESAHERQQRIFALVKAQSELELLTRSETPKSKDTRDRVAVLLSKVASLKSGFPVHVADLEELNATEIRAGLPRTASLPSVRQKETRALARAWDTFIRGGNPLTDPETRAGLVGAPLFSFSQGTGAFVPVGWYDRLMMLLKDYSPLFNSQAVSFLNTMSGAPVQIPILDDTGVSAVELSESSANSATDLVLPSHVQTQPSRHTFRSPSYLVSLEAIQDVDPDAGCFQFEDCFARWAHPRIARGAGSALMNGPIPTKSTITGLLSSLIANGALGRTAQGSSANDGSSATGANSIGSDDLKGLFHSVDPQYRASARCAWIMADSTLLAIDQLKDKQGRPLNLVEWRPDYPCLMGKRVWTDPNLPPIQPSQETVIFGDLSYWLTHISASGNYIRRFDEGPGLAEFGLIELVAFFRVDGAYMAQPSNGASNPIQYLQQHS